MKNDRLKKMYGLACVLLLGLTTSAVAAQGVLYDCNLTQLKRGGGWVSEKVAIVLHENGTASVSDKMVLRVHGAPMQARIARNTDRRLVVRWTIEGYTNGDHQRTPYFDYHAIIRKDGEIGVYAKPTGYRNRFWGSGQCEMRTG